MAPTSLVVVLDANVLFPFTLRDTLLRAAAADLYQLRWSAHILDEMTRNLVSTGTMSAAKAKRLRMVMEREFPDADVRRYESLIPSMQNHPKDRHVVAAAVKTGAQIITTSNLRDFAALPKGIEARSPDQFLGNLFDLSPDLFMDLLREQARDLLNPPIDLPELLERLARVAPGVVAAVRRRLGT